MFTICCGERYKKLSELTIPNFIDYSKKINSHFECITKTNQNWPKSVSLKLRTKDYLKEYKRVFFIDLDCYIHPDAPNIFEEHPNESFYIKKMPRDGFFQINSGVFIANQSHKEIFEPCPIEEPQIEQAEQSVFEKTLCQQLNNSMLKIESLKPDWHVCPYDQNKSFHIYHAHDENKRALLLKKIIETKIKFQ